MISQYDTVALVCDDAEYKLMAGDLGAVVEIYGDGVAFDVEFVRLDGTTAALITLKPDQIRQVSGNEIPHAREIAA